ncbi:hypothetical protein GHT06_003739 [Daphnia sinensis]|uniref:Uncharacterized protein n=1 Tax=Daphnia sinensis TaxID=1820382 RepID=A0AAD5PL77_9CRUS|nr:hypothetical protein GHT06_003739 [Daphnia sinensis]
MFVNLSLASVNADPSRLTNLLIPGNSTITINGIKYNLTYVGKTNEAYRFTYNPSDVSGPPLKDNDVITTSFNWGCETLNKSSHTVFMKDNQFSTSVVPEIVNCELQYRISILGSAGNPERRIFYCPETTRVKVEKITATGDIQVYPNANAIGTFNFTSGIYAQAGIGAYVQDLGKYRVTVSDACQSASKIVDVVKSDPLAGITMTPINGIAEGTAGINFTGMPNGMQYNVKITPTDPNAPTSVIIPVNTKPLSYNSIQKEIIFPYSVNFTGPMYIVDLPKGSYNVELSAASQDCISGEIKISKPINLTTDITTVFCDPSNSTANSGNISVKVASGTLNYPLTMTLLDATKTNTIRATVDLPSPTTEQSYQRMQFRRSTSSAYNCKYSTYFTASQLTICNGSFTDLSVFNGSTELYDIEWYYVNQDNTIGSSVRSTRISLGCTVILTDKIDILYNDCLEITKTTTATEYDAEDEVLPYTITVKNKGGIDLTGVAVKDPLTELNQLVDLNGNSETDFPTQYTVKQVDLSNPSIENTATASITLGGVLYEKSASVTVPNGLFEVDGLNCAANSYVIADDTDVDFEVKVPYTSGNPISYAAGKPISLGNGTLTAVLQAGTIDPTGGDLVYRVTGRASVPVDAKFKVEFGDSDCEVTIRITQAAVQKVNFTVNTYEDLNQDCVQDSGEVQVAASTDGLFLKIFDRNDVFVESFPDFEGQFDVVDLNISAGLIYYYIIDDNDDDTDLSPALGTGWASGIAPLKRYFQISPSGAPLFNSDLVVNLLDPSWNPIDKSICLFRVSGLIDSIDCNSAVLPNLVKGTAVNDAPFGVEYSGGNGGDFANLVIQSLGVKGLTATLQSGRLEEGDGTLNFTLSGTPDSGGEAIFQLNIGGKTCDVKVQVAAPSTSTRSDYSVVGEIIPYTIEVKNDGNVALTNVVVTDPLTGLTNTILNLAPGASNPIPTSYAIKQADIEAGEFKNTAFAAFTYEGKNYPANADLTIKAIKKPAVSIVKTSTQVSYKSVGEVLNYTITVSNTGNVNLSNLEVRDPLTGFIRTISSLAVGASESFTTSYPVTQADVDAGKVRNTASVGFVYDGNPASVSAVKDIDYVRVNAVIQAVLDDFSSKPINIQATTTAGNVLSNDLMDGLPVVASAVQIKVIDMGGLTGIVINANGELVLPSTTPAGTYTIKYSICDAKNLSNCSETTAVITVLSGVDLRIIKVAVGSNWFEGDELVYTLVVDNMGSAAASNVVVVDNLPTSLRYISSEIIGGVGTTAVAGQVLTWTIGSIPAGKLVEIKLVVKILEIPADTKVTISNIGTVTSLESDMNSVDNSSLATIQVEPFFIPNVITPNGDGLNDQFEIKGLGKFVKNDIVIWNRWGDHILTVEDYQNDWAADGLKQGTYYYILKALDEGNTQHVFKGWIQVITQ